jgi:nucleoside 2-deoxyribosyltransferase
MNVYLAAPLFSVAEREFNSELALRIEHACDVHLPQRDGPLVAQDVRSGADAAQASRRAFESDIAAIRRCDVLVAILDGRALDEGVCVEIGYAKALGKAVVGFKSDERRSLPWGNNPMIDGCVDAWVRSTEELRTWIERHADARGRHDGR